MSSAVQKDLLLIVEDDKLVRETIVMLAELYEVNVLAVEDGREALEALATNDSIGCILSDVRMPNMNGIELINKVSENYQGMPFIFMTGYSEESEASLKSLGAIAVLMKPFDNDELFKHVFDALNIKKED